MTSEAHTNRRSVGLVGAIATITGTLIGGGLFALPSQLILKAGPAVLVSFLLASLAALFFCFVAADLSRAFSVTGASFVSVSRLFSLRTGFLMILLLLLGFPLAAAILAYAFVDYLSVFIPAVPELPTALGLVLLMVTVNLISVRTAVGLQMLLVVVMLVLLIMFAGLGLGEADFANFSPFAPEGWSAAIGATVPAFFAFLGFSFIMELGGEIKNPKRNIPLALIISFIISLAILLGVTSTMIGSLTIVEISQFDAPMVSVAERIMGNTLKLGIGIAALAALATSLNGIILGASREIFVLANSGLLPEIFAKCSEKNNVPVGGVITIALLCMLAIVAGGGILQYASAVVLGVMFVQISLALAYLSMHKKQANNVFFHMPLRNMFFGLATIVSSGAIALISLIDDYKTTLAVSFVFMLGWVYFDMRTRYLTKQGFDVEQHIKAQVIEEQT